MVRTSAASLLFGLCGATNYTLPLYDSQSGQLGETLQSWSYGAVELQVSAPAGLPSQGKYAMSIGAGWSTQLNMHGSLVFEFGDLLELSLQVYGAGATEGATIELMQGDSSTRAGKAVSLKAVPKGEWRSFVLPVSAFGSLAANQQLNGVHVSIQPSDADPADAALLVADVQIVARLPAASAASVKLGTATGRRVSSRLFGVNFGTDDGKWQSFYTTNRWGGNAVTRYAWESDIQNRAADWFFEDIPNEVVDESALPFNSSSDLFVEQTLQKGALPVLTIPTIGWAPKAERARRCGFSVAKYGQQQQSDPNSADCGNGMLTNGTALAGNDPEDTSRAVGPEYGVAWLRHLEEAFGKQAVQSMLYILDNEPNYWSSTHRDVHPDALSYDELWNKTLTYSQALLEAYPGLQLMGPDVSGTADLFTQSCGEDCKAHGSLPLIEWFIQQLGAHETASGQQLLQYLDIHCYPEAPRLKAEVPDLTLRLRSTRELWDEGFFAEAWHSMRMGYIRRIQQLIQQHAPWLKISCTEFSYGLQEEDVVDAVLTLDALAVYAREGVDLATRWLAPALSSPTAYAYQLLHTAGVANMTYLNATSSEPLLGAHGFQGDNKLELLLVCRQQANQLTADLDLGAFSGTAELHRLDAAHSQASEPEVISVTGGKAQVIMPPVSAALLVAETTVVVV